MHCHRCGAAMPADARWCGSCGAALRPPAGHDSRPSPPDARAILRWVLPAGIVGLVAMGLVLRVVTAGSPAGPAASGPAGAVTLPSRAAGVAPPDLVPRGPDTPAIRWSRQLERPAWGVEIAEGRVFVTIGDELRAYAADTGDMLWAATTAGSPDAPRSAPLAIADRVVVARPDGGVTAFYVATGARAWDAAGRTFDVEAPRLTLVAEGEPLLVAESGGRAIAYRVADGRPRWLVQDISAVSAWLVGAPNLVAVRGAPTGGRPSTLVGIDVTTGRPAWTTPLDGRVVLAPVQDGGRAVVRVDDRLVVVDAREGTLTPLGQGRFVGAPVLAGGMVVVGTFDGVEALGLDGRVRWHDDRPGEVVAGRGIVALLLEHGIRVTGLDVRTGDERFAVTPSGWFGGEATDGSSLVLVTSSPTRGRLEVYDLGREAQLGLGAAPPLPSPPSPASSG